jgi:hypothetical protein
MLPCNYCEVAQKCNKLAETHSIVSFSWFSSNSENLCNKQLPFVAGVSTEYRSALIQYKRPARGTEVQTATSPTQTPSSLPVVQPALTNEAIGTESRRYNCCIIRRGHAAEHACPEVTSWKHHNWTT